MVLSVLFARSALNQSYTPADVETRVTRIYLFATGSLGERRNAMSASRPISVIQAFQTASKSRLPSPYRLMAEIAKLTHLSTLAHKLLAGQRYASHPPYDCI